MEWITSRDNQRLVHARKVRDGRDTELMFIEGKRLVDEAMRSSIAIRECFVSDAMNEAAIDDQRLKVPQTTLVSDRVFKSLADTTNSQGVVLLADRPAWSVPQVTDQLAKSAVPIIVYLDEVNNPSNLGAIIRTVEAAGAAGLITSPGSADAYSAKALRGSMGSAFRLPILRNILFEDAADFAHEASLSIVAAAATGTEAYTSIDWIRPHMLILGSEAHGLSADTKLAQHQTINIPLNSEVESLNLAVSAGVILFEARRQVVS